MHTPWTPLGPRLAWPLLNGHHPAGDAFRHRIKSPVDPCRPLAWPWFPLTGFG